MRLAERLNPPVLAELEPRGGALRAGFYNGVSASLQAQLHCHAFEQFAFAVERAVEAPMSALECCGR